MRKKHAYLLYILPSEDEPNTICGQVKDISTGKTFSFHSLDELNAIIASEAGQRQINEEKAAYTVRKTN